MSGCNNYNAMCSTPGSVVAQCNATVVATESTMMTGSRIKALCSVHNMMGCEKCDLTQTGMLTTCNVLDVYSEVSH